MTRFIVLSAILLSVGTLRGAILDDAEIPVPAPLAEGAAGRYIYFTERNPQDGSRLYNLATPGVGIAVGSERAFLMAAMAKRLSHLLMLDRDPKVVHYNKINIALLKAAENRQDYIHLRLHASKAEWADRLQLAEDWNWWQEMMKSHRSYDFFHRTIPASEFIQINYLFHDDQFDTLSLLAKSDRIQAHQLDLGDRKSVSYLVSTARINSSPRDAVKHYLMSSFLKTKTSRLPENISFISSVDTMQMETP